MDVKIQFGTPLSLVIGENQILFSMEDGANLNDLIHLLDAQYPGFDDGLKGKNLLAEMWTIPCYRMIVNAKNIHWEDVASFELQDGDSIKFLLPYSGG